MSFSPIQNMWIEALRSGKYKQGRRRLFGDDAYCCLGVACELLGIPKKQDSVGAWVFGDGMYGVISSDVAKQLGLHDEFGTARVRPNPGLMTMNDEGVSFAAIADLLETGVYFEQDKSAETSQVLGNESKEVRHGGVCCEQK